MITLLNIILMPIKYYKKWNVHAIGIASNEEARNRKSSYNYEALYEGSRALASISEIKVVFK